jgi:hypothetical protein
LSTEHFILRVTDQLFLSRHIAFKRTHSTNGLNGLCYKACVKVRCETDI